MGDDVQTKMAVLSTYIQNQAERLAERSKWMHDNLPKYRAALDRAGAPDRHQRECVALHCEFDYIEGHYQWVMVQCPRGHDLLRVCAAPTRTEWDARLIAEPLSWQAQMDAERVAGYEPPVMPAEWRYVDLALAVPSHLVNEPDLDDYDDNQADAMRVRLKCQTCPYDGRWMQWKLLAYYAAAVEFEQSRFRLTN